MRSRKDNSSELQSYVEQLIAHQDKLRAFIYSLLPGNSHVHDVLQNTNAVLWQKRGRFKADTNFTAWAFKIARIQVMHQLDRAKRDGRLVFSEKLIDTIAEDTHAGDNHDRLLRALEGCVEKLTDHQRTLIRARYTPGHSLEKQAEETGRSPGSLRIALHRIRDALKSCVEATLAGESA
ncbi:sigma-70 family RNA polymerase sigma factor [Haloferula sp. A504]|uniref:sigma-70 family RNA polymerase sigma factor n=1 Tax=Haloferula sp. A504 TaxID=3373601 RepID=UPI0031C33158|nr:sigma-70 family RNA polymerase sigma factor [Verrucomicrobiaceae bacterium E54]